MPENRVVGSIGSPSRPILISLGEVEGSRVVDIRRHYIDKESKELRPTQKGISIQAANFAEIFACLADAYGPITEWLEGGGATDQVKRQGAAVKAAASGVRPRLKTEAWRGASFFKVHTQGAEVEVALKADHPIADRVKSVTSSSEAAQLLADLLATFQFAAGSAAVDEDARTVALPQLETAWSNQLGSMLKDRKGR
jgi:hypothetical protein